jgi:hypothetical protein
MFVPKLKGVDIDDVLLLNKVLLTGTRQVSSTRHPCAACVDILLQHAVA